jgi:hypothetical protein
MFDPAKYVERHIKWMFDWLHFIFHPLEGVTLLFDRVKRDNSWNPYLEIWVPTMVVSYFVSALIYNFVGINMEDPVFYGSILLLQIAQLFVFTFLLDFFLRTKKLKSNFRQTLAICTILVVYSPLLSVILGYASVRAALLMKGIKHQDLSFYDTLVEFFKVFWINAEAVSLPIQLINYVAGMIAILSLSAVTECITQLYDNPRWPTYRVIAATLIVSLLPAVLIFLPLSIFATYSVIP